MDNFDSVLGKLRKFKDELEKAKEKGVHMPGSQSPGQSVAGGAARYNLTGNAEHNASAGAKIMSDRAKEGHKNVLSELKSMPKPNLTKYDESRQDGVNVEPEMTAQEKAKKAEFLAMSQHGQWSLHKADGKSQGSNPPKSENRKRFEKEVKDHSPTGEEPERAAEEVDSAQIKRKYRAGEGAGASPNRLHKSEAEPHKDDPHHEAKEKKIGKEIKSKAEKLLDMHKEESKKKVNKMDDMTTLAGPVGSYDAIKMDEGSPMSGDYHATGIEKKDLPKDAEYQKHTKEPKERA